MPRKDIAIPPVRGDSWQAELQAELAGSMCLDTEEDVTSAEDVLNLARDHQLWTARAGGCRMNVSVQILGQIVYGRDAVTSLAGWIQELEIWPRLGLKVEYCDNEGFSTTDSLSFSIQHPDLSSSLIAPEGARTADLVSISCSISVSAIKRRRANKRKRRRGDAGVISAEDRSAVENFVSSLAVDDTDELHCLWTTRQDGLFRAKQLIQGILTLFITGSARNGPTVKVVENNGSYALVRMLPSVFHVPYITAISERSRYIDVISSCLETMRDAESPTLRRKVAVLTASTETAPNVADSDFPNMETAIWNTLLANVKVPSLMRKPTGRSTDTSLRRSAEVARTPPLVTEFCDELYDDVHGEDTNYPVISFGEDLFTCHMQMFAGPLDASLESSSVILHKDLETFDDPGASVLAAERSLSEDARRLHCEPIVTGRTSSGTVSWMGNGTVSFDEEILKL